MHTLGGAHYIGGSWVQEAPHGLTSSINPATGEHLGSAPNGSRDLGVLAIQSARKAFETGTWSCDPKMRYDVLMQFADALEEQASDIAHLLSQETGKILAQARHEVAAGYNEARYYAGLARNIFGRTFESAPGKMSLITREPSGVVSVIVPWNAPVTLLVRSVAPALAAGCTVVIKPAVQSVLTHSAVMACFDKVSALPEGVVNSVNEHKTELGELFSTHPDIDVVSFTGSSRTGKLIMSNAANSIKQVCLELGGKAPAIIFEDADLDNAILEIRRASLALNGQMCTALSRVLVHENVYSDVQDRLVQAFQNVKIGNPLAEGVELGPLIDRENLSRIQGLIDRASDEVETLLKGGVQSGELEKGFYISPSIFKVSDVNSWIVQEEHFGPIITLEQFSNEQEAITKANATRFGLAASVYTQDFKTATQMSRKLRFGTIWLNSHNRLFAEAETGGYRQSGIGRLHGIEALDNFLETKHFYYENNRA